MMAARILAPARTLMATWSRRSRKFEAGHVEDTQMSTAKAYAAFDPTAPLSPFSVERRAPGPTDVQFDIKYCGVCHSDVHTVRSEWAATAYPCVPGHEIVGHVTAVGANVKHFKVGDIAAVGCMVDSCGTCASCRGGQENYCDNSDITYTYNSPDKKSDGTVTMKSTFLSMPRTASVSGSSRV